MIAPMSARLAPYLPAVLGPRATSASPASFRPVVEGAAASFAGALGWHNASCIWIGSCSLHNSPAKASFTFFRNALRISFARITVTRGCWRHIAGIGQKHFLLFRLYKLPGLIVCVCICSVIWKLRSRKLQNSKAHMNRRCSIPLWVLTYAKILSERDSLKRRTGQLWRPNILFTIFDIDVYNRCNNRYSNLVLNIIDCRQQIFRWKYHIPRLIKCPKNSLSALKQENKVVAEHFPRSLA